MKSIFLHLECFGKINSPGIYLLQNDWARHFYISFLLVPSVASSSDLLMRLTFFKFRSSLMTVILLFHCAASESEGDIVIVLLGILYLREYCSDWALVNEGGWVKGCGSIEGSHNFIGHSSWERLYMAWIFAELECMSGDRSLWDLFWIAPQAIAPEGVYQLYSLSSNYSLQWSTINCKVAILRSVLVSIRSIFICFGLLPSSKICTRLLWQHVPQVQDLVSKLSRQKDLNLCLLHFKFLLNPLYHILAGYYGRHKVPIELWWFKT
jgi:hypothetical protein